MRSARSARPSVSRISCSHRGIFLRGGIYSHWSIDFSGPFPTARAFGRSKDEKAIEGVSIESFGGPPQEEDFNEWFYSSEPEADSEPEVARESEAKPEVALESEADGR